MRNIVLYSLLSLLLCFSQGCEKSHLEADSILLPAGRMVSGSDTLTIFLNDREIAPELFCDKCGGYWYRIPAGDIREGDRVLIRYVSAEGETPLYREEVFNSGRCLEASYYIDSDHEEILKKAKQLTLDTEGAYARARKIQIYLAAYFPLKVYNNSFKDKASESLALGYGTCMNASRLFVALCRALDIPARTVWGVIYDHEDNGIFDYHHQWAEFQDEEGYWHPLDFGYTTYIDLDDLRYIDLLYGAEENPLLRKRISEYPVLGNVDYFRDYPAPASGMLGFSLEEDNRPDNMIVSYTFEY